MMNSLMFSIAKINRSLSRVALAVALSGSFASSALLSLPAVAAQDVHPAKKVIIFVWDGLRPDSVTPEVTPNLARLREQSGVNFSDHHSVYPTFTMMNAAALATGAYPGRHGFFGNTEYQPGPQGKNAKGAKVDFNQPFFTEDYAILKDLDTFYNSRDNADLFMVSTLFQQAHKAGLKTAVVGKSGPAFIQDYKQDGKNGVILDENMAYPQSFAQHLQQAGLALPANIVNAYPPNSVTLSANNGDPTASTATVLLKDKTDSDPRAVTTSPFNAKNEYMMKVYLSDILPVNHPDLSLIWFRNPDSTEHTYGPGTPAYRSALADQDKLLGALLSKLDDMHLRDTTDVIVVSDHGHSTVAGDPAKFPLRPLMGESDGRGEVDLKTHADNHSGYAVSGDVRTADLLTRAGFAHVYDGNGCLYDPILSGIKADGTPLYPTQIDKEGKVCGKVGMQYTYPSYLVPEKLANDSVIVAANGGSDYLYVPSHNSELIAKLVRALQARQQYGAVFVHSRYGNLPGTLSLKDIFNELPASSKRQSPPNPDIIVSFNFDENGLTAANQSVPGTEYESAQVNRGMHGSFSPRDVHNTLIASGPDFRQAFVDSYPSGNVDVAPTVAYLLGIQLPDAQGRVLNEALVSEYKTAHYQLEKTQRHSSLVKGIGICDVLDVNCATVRPGEYRFTLQQKLLTDKHSKKTYIYLDKADAKRNY
jgi:predicted AlkP superfamily pyrophosphatase or phosphodiesterase